jgi:hypothetical protein
MSGPDDAFIAKITQGLVDQGLLIEAGWIGLEHMVIPIDAGPMQRAEMKKAFFAGAQHLFSSIMGILEEGDDATEADLRRMGQIEQELRAFADLFTEELKTKGRT